MRGEDPESQDGKLLIKVEAESSAVRNSLTSYLSRKLRLQAICVCETPARAFCLDRQSCRGTARADLMVPAAPMSSGCY